MGTADASSWTRKRQSAFARVVSHCATCWSSLDLRFLDTCETQTLTLPLYSQGCSEVLMKAWAEGALMCVSCHEHQWQVPRTQVGVKSTESTGQKITSFFSGLELDLQVKGRYKSQWWPRNSNLPGPSEP